MSILYFWKWHFGNRYLRMALIGDFLLGTERASRPACTLLMPGTEDCPDDTEFSGAPGPRHGPLQGAAIYREAFLQTCTEGIQ